MAGSSSSVDVAIIGAGPYGLSLAAHLRARNVEHRTFGESMGSWKNNMPPGMLLKSYPWASDLSDPRSEFTVKSFCTEQALPYHDELMPLPLSRFVDYGEAFQARYVPAVERKTLLSLEPVASGRNPPAWMLETVCTIELNISCASPAITASIDGPPPL